MSTRALSFGSAAAAYERFRLGYPDELVDQVLGYANRPVRTALEIGAGTGKATRAFAARGVTVTATDPDEAMLAELRRHVPASVTTVCSTLEGLPARPTYDLVFAAASLHWTEPQHRWARVAALLEQGGVFASFGGPMSIADPVVAEAVRAARVPEVPDDHVPSPDGTPPDDPMQWPGTELLGTDLFGDVRQSTFERRTTMAAREVVDHLSTLSAYLVLDGLVRRQVLERVLAALPDRVPMSADLLLHLARKV
jgi:SAM-dependent methyltransferase